MEGLNDKILALIYKIFLKEQWHSKPECNEEFIKRFNRIIRENSKSSLKLIYSLHEDKDSPYDGEYTLVGEDNNISENLLLEMLEYLFNEDPEILPVWHVNEDNLIDNIKEINKKLREYNSNIRIVIEDKVRVYNIIAKEKL